MSKAMVRLSLILGAALIFAAPFAFSQLFIPMSYWGCSTPRLTDSTSGDLTEGTSSNLSYLGTSLQLTVGQTSGTYTSNVFDKGRCQTTALVAFTQFLWTTDIPYGKELPTTSELTTDYPVLASSSLLTGIAGIWRMNGTGAIANGAAIAAATGTAGVASNSGGTGMTYLAAGKLQSGITFDGTDDYVDVAYTQTGVSDYTIAAWFRTNTAGNSVFVQNRGAGTGRSMTLGIGANPGGCAAGRISYGLDSNSIYIGRCTTSTYNDNNWHHVVGVWDGTSGAAVASGQFTIYVDGVVAASSGISVGTAPNAPLSGSGNTRFGRHDAWNRYLTGSLDELAIWTRNLSGTEAQQLYQRGGNRVKFQIRACSSPSCADNPGWMGYSGDNTTFFSELNNNTLPATMAGNVQTAEPVMTFSDFVALILANTQFFQYQITFESDSTALVPKVESVTVAY